MLAYVFWHSPSDRHAVAAYEEATATLHRSLDAQPPDGFAGSATYRAGTVPWLAGDATLEDWYLIDDWAALGVLRAAAVGAGHLTAHDDAARRAGAGTAGLYHLAAGTAPLADATQAVWVSPARGNVDVDLVALLLGDGLERSHAGLWQRELALGPAPEFCLLVREAPAGIGMARVPAGWVIDAQPRELLWCSERLVH